MLRPHPLCGPPRLVVGRRRLGALVELELDCRHVVLRVYRAGKIRDARARCPRCGGVVIDREPIVLPRRVWPIRADIHERFLAVLHRVDEQIGVEGNAARDEPDDSTPGEPT